MSAEHLFRATYRNRIPHHPLTSRTRFRPGVSGSEQVTEMPMGLFDHKVNGICKPCNESWMNDLDAAVEATVVALATGTEVMIRRRDVASFARWSTKVALLRAWVDKSSGWEPDADLFKVFHETREPPPGTVIRVGIADQMVKQGGSNSIRSGYVFEHDVALPEDQQRPPMPVRLNAVSWGIGFLYVHVILHSPGIEDVAGDASARVSQALGQSAVMIHPTSPRNVRFTRFVSPRAAARAGNLHHLVDGQPLHPSD